LFTADGGMQDGGKKGGTVRLAANHLALLEGVQQILLNFGIASTIYRNRRSVHLKPMPDGRGGMKAYLCAPQHELAISKRNLVTFADEIGFLMGYKQRALIDYITRGKRGPYAERFTATVESVTADGVEAVFDLTEPSTHSFIGNGIVVHNCGEQGISPWSVCNLAALNLSMFVENGQMNYDTLAAYARVGMRFSDNVIDANLYFIKENEEEQLGTRRTGLGTMGLADALIKMGVRYGSAEATTIIEAIYRTIRDAAYDESANIAAEKGPFPRFDREKYLQGKFIQTLPEEIRAKIARQGIRNAVILTQAPTGTTSLVAGVSSGIEPVFDFAFRRVDRTGESIIYHPLLAEWMEQHPDQERPDYFVGANDLTPEDHIRVQAMVQQYTDSSISKTCNAPNSHTVEQVEQLYMLAYDSGCKGVTYYRDGSRDAVLHHIDTKEKKDETPAPPPAPAVIDRAIRSRPAVVHGYTRNMKAPEGTVNITLNSDDEGLLEVFVNVGRAGSDIAALAEALGRLTGVLLRLPSPLTPEERTREVVNQLRGIGGSRTVGFGLEQVRSLPDAIGLALQKHLEGQIGPTTPARGGVTATQQPLPGLHLTGNLCPECGSTAFVYEEGCKKCHACGHSEC
jgi:ribonucleoside-diphosphate reductase alpha chain